MTEIHSNRPDEFCAPSHGGEITRLLDAWRRGEGEADERLLDRLYPELKRLAAASVQRMGGAGSFEATELVHESFFKLQEQRRVLWQNRGHFFAIAARVLRRTLVDHHRHRTRLKRDGGLQEVPLEDVDAASDGSEIEALALDQAMRRLATVDPTAARTVRLLAVAGLSYDEAAVVMGVGRATVSRSWRFARAFLRAQLASHRTP